MISIDRDKFKTETSKKLYDILIEKIGHTESIYGILSRLQGDEKRQNLINFIEDENVSDSDVIILASLDIADGIEI